AARRGLLAGRGPLLQGVRRGRFRDWPGSPPLRALPSGQRFLAGAKPGAPVALQRAVVEALARPHHRLEQRCRHAHLPRRPEGRAARALRGRRGGRRWVMAALLARHLAAHHAGALLQRRNRAHRGVADVRGRVLDPDPADGAESLVRRLLPVRAHLQPARDRPGGRRELDPRRHHRVADRGPVPLQPVGALRMKRGIGIFLLAPVVVGAPVVFLDPRTGMTGASLKSIEEVQQPQLSLMPEDPEWSNYPELIAERNFFRAYGNSIFITVVVLLGTVSSL